MKIQQWRNLYKRLKFVPVSYGNMEGYRDSGKKTIETQYYPEAFIQLIHSNFQDACAVDSRYSVYEFSEDFEESINAMLFYPTKKIEFSLTVKKQENQPVFSLNYWIFETKTSQFRKELTEEERSKLEQLLLLCLDFVELQGCHRLHIATQECDYQFESFQYVLENRKDDKNEHCVHV